MSVKNVSFIIIYNAGQKKTYIFISSSSSSSPLSIPNFPPSHLPFPSFPPLQLLIHLPVSPPLHLSYLSPFPSLPPSLPPLLPPLILPPTPSRPPYIKLQNTDFVLTQVMEHHGDWVMPVRKMVEPFTFVNHTQCGCKPIKQLPK